MFNELLLPMFMCLIIKLFYLIKILVLVDLKKNNGEKLATMQKFFKKRNIFIFLIIVTMAIKVIDETDD